MSELFSPIELGDIKLSNRIVMAPMTRSRATTDHIPTESMAQYYAQRATAGLIIAEGTAPSATGIGYCRTPGIYNAAQIKGWQTVTRAVHAQGGKIVLQLMHVGRISSHYNKPDGAGSVAPSAITANVDLFTDEHGLMPVDHPKELTTAEIKSVIDEYKTAALNARKAGFDGVELHCTSGYLPMQFMASGSNQRSDKYGGSVDNRVRFASEILQALADAIGPGRVGYRIRLGNTFNDIYDASPVETTIALINSVNHLQLAYLHMMDPHQADLDVFQIAREHCTAKLIINDSFDADSAAKAIDAGVGHAVSFARDFIANPDLVARIRNNQPLSQYNPETVYTPGAPGYTDYPNYG